MQMESWCRIHGRRIAIQVAMSIRANGVLCGCKTESIMDSVGYGNDCGTLYVACWLADRAIVPEDTLSLVPLLPLLHRVLCLTAFRSGSLLLKFEKGAEIEVPIHDRYEAWEMFGTGETADIGMRCGLGAGAPWD